MCINVQAFKNEIDEIFCVSVYFHDEHAQGGMNVDDVRLNLISYFYSTVTDLAKFRGQSTLQSRNTAI